MKQILTMGLTQKSPSFPRKQASIQCHYTVSDLQTALGSRLKLRERRRFCGSSVFMQSPCIHTKNSMETPERLIFAARSAAHRGWANPQTIVVGGQFFARGLKSFHSTAQSNPPCAPLQKYP